MSDKDLQQENRGIWIPSEVWESKTLSIQEKVLLARIYSFKECFASNQYLADFLGLSVTRTKEIITSLVRSGYLFRNEERKGNLTVKRTLVVNRAKYFGVNEHGTESRPTPAEKQAHPQPESRHHSNTELGIQDSNLIAPSTDGACKACDGTGIESQFGYGQNTGEKCPYCQGTGKEPQPPAKPEKPKKYEDEINEVFDFWKTTMGKTGATKLDSNRRGKIQNRLKDGYDVEYIKQAITNCSMTPHNMGQNDRGQKYNDIELICRNAEKLERFYESNPMMAVKPQQPNQPYNPNSDFRDSMDNTY